MSQMVFSVNTNGDIEHTLMDHVLDSRELGRRTIARLTEIKHDEAQQKFFIEWLRGPREGQVEPILFDTYHDAVAYEVLIVNQSRLTGQTFA